MCFAAYTHRERNAAVAAAAYIAFKLLMLVNQIARSKQRCKFALISLLQ